MLWRNDLKPVAISVTEKVFGWGCTRCRYVSSATAGTLFQGCKFSILEAFYTVYYVSTNKSGISITELNRKLALRQKTCRLFKRNDESLFYETK